MLLVNKIAALCAIALSSGVATAQQVPVYMDESKPLEARVSDALSRMSTAEKIAIIHAQSKFSSPGVPRLGIPELWCSDGPHGVRAEVLWDAWKDAGWTNDSITAFPALTCLAATWNPEMSAIYGKAVGEEARYRKKDVLLGPGVNMLRTPLNGRNFEYMGEDPYLASVMVVPYIKGVQSNGVAACVKHFALNSEEINRHTVSVDVSDRALYEIYLPAFKAAVMDGGVWSIMSSYNLYRGRHVSQHPRLLKDILRGEWGFDGAVISDWGAVHNSPEAIEGGLDLEYGSWTNGLDDGSRNAFDNYYMAGPYLDRIMSGELDTKELDVKAANVLRLIMRTAMGKKNSYGIVGNDEHMRVARTIGAEGIVLLKNDNNILPLDVASGRKKIAVIGENAVKMMTSAGGSSKLKVKYEVAPLDGLRRSIGDKADILFARGYVGEPSGHYMLDGKKYQLNDTRSAQELKDEALKVAREADVVLFFGGLNKARHNDCEGVDRHNYELPYGQSELIEELVKVNPNIVMVNVSGNPVAMPWVNKVPAVVQAWYIGSEAGNAIADVLTGAVNPSGKLPFTFPASLNDVGAHKLGTYPGTWRHPENTKHKGDTINENYAEDIFIGYRWADKEKTTPVFPFGHGLSYTTFEYGKPVLSAKEMTADGNITLTVPVKNTGNRAGAEVIQLYISDVKSSMPRPVKELKGFDKVMLQPGEEKTVTFVIDSKALQYFDADRHEWIAEPGKFQAHIGASSRDIRASLPFTLK